MSDTPQDFTPPTAASTAEPGRASAQRTPGRIPSARVSGLAALIATLALALAAWQWHGSRSEIGELQQKLAQRPADADTQGRTGRLVAEQVREAVADAQAKLGVLESRLAESRNQQAALESLYQELSRNRDEWAYAEIEQSLLIASQQLQVAGNVKGALAALQAVDARLQRMERAQVTGLRRALNRDIERLKAAPQVDTVAISARLDSLIGQVDRLPLAMDLRPQAEPRTTAAQDGERGVWTRLWRDTWVELGQLVRVQRVDQPDVALLAPSQAFFLRENLKLRLLGARLALLARDQASFKADLAAARDWIGRFYDARGSGVANALATLGDLQAADVGIEVPDISATLEAMRGLRPQRPRGGR